MKIGNFEIKVWQIVLVALLMCVLVFGLSVEDSMKLVKEVYVYLLEFRQ